jgi:hypothetical protein
VTAFDAGWGAVLVMPAVEQPAMYTPKGTGQ